MKVKIEDQEMDITIRVVDGSGPSLLGRDLMEKITLPWKSIFKIRVTVEDVMKDCADLIDTKAMGSEYLSLTELTLTDDNRSISKAYL